VSNWTKKMVEQLDREDALASYRDRFSLPDGLIYLDGNSLGVLPRTTAARLDDVIKREWGSDLIRSWNSNDWIRMPQKLGDMIAPLIGADAGEVIVADSTSVNLFKLVAAAKAMRPGRDIILSEEGNFPTDLYVLQGIADMLGEFARYKTVPADQILKAVNSNTAVVSLTHVNYRSGSFHHMQQLTRGIQEKGALVVWDLSHTAGAMPIDLGACNADFAVGCGYKYLNGGPGAPAYLYVAKRHQEQVKPPLSGWMGHKNPFAFDDDYEPASGIDRNLCGTPAILALAALEEGLKTFDGVDLDALRAKSMKLGDLFLDLVERELEIYGIAIACPRRAIERGSQVSLTNPQGYAIMQALIDHGVIGDFRAPDVMRFGFTPLYTRYMDVWNAVQIMMEIMNKDVWKSRRYQIAKAVT
jgi:kynureninase